jgi:hypothetical protein
MRTISNYNPTARASEVRATTVVAALILGLVLVALPRDAASEPLDWGFATFGAKGFFSQIHGRMGFNQANGFSGTFNDLQNDLGLPTDNQTIEFDASVRPLEHHLLRLFGRIPEYYTGKTAAPRELRTRNTVYPAGSPISSEFRTATFGFGYDLDLMIGPRWYGGLQAELRYIDLKLSLSNAASAHEDTIAVDETVPCLGAHMASRFPFGLGFALPASRLGAMARMTFGITPNYLNYMDLMVGGTFLAGARTSPVILEGKCGYQHESFFHNQELASGRSVEIKRDGLFVSLELAY